jgi:wyosine [tRNA(Phe)-imidazoG37] synthetase (radical SAM superfamily)
MTDNKIAFGPVPSRRLGPSLGINNIPPKTCTYSCVYCQLGRTEKTEIERHTFYEPEKILKVVQKKVEKDRESAEPIDYLTFVADGEPTLDVNLGREIELLRAFGIRVAVITNASLIWREDVSDDLMKADWVSLKIDSVRKEIWRRINRPFESLNLDSILDGMLEFAKMYRGELTTETMLVKDLNDGENLTKEIADFLGRLRPAKAYLAIPTRPPAEKWIKPPSGEALNQAYQIMNNRVVRVEYLTGYEGNSFAFTGNVEEDLLSIAAVHPMREDAVGEFLEKAGTDWSAIEALKDRDKLLEVDYEGLKFYVRKLPTRPNHPPRRQGHKIDSRARALK